MFEGNAAFNFVDKTNMRIGGWETLMRAQTREGVPSFFFAVIDFSMVLGSENKGAMSTPFFDAFMKAFIRFKSPTCWNLTSSQT